MLTPSAMPLTELTCISLLPIKPCATARASRRWSSARGHPGVAAKPPQAAAWLPSDRLHHPSYHAAGQAESGRVSVHPDPCVRMRAADLNPGHTDTPCPDP